MKILIISLPRTGSTVMVDLLSDKLNLMGYNEPLRSSRSKFEHEEFFKTLKNTNNIVVKDIIDYRPHTISIEEYNKWVVGYCEMFDKVVFLSRRNEKDHIESYINLLFQNQKYNENNNITHYPWNVRYMYEDIPTDFIDNSLKSDEFKDFMEQRQRIIDLSKELNKELIWYEDIFLNENKKEYVLRVFPELKGIDFMDYLNTSNKLRVSREKSII